MDWRINLGFSIFGILLIMIFMREIRKAQSVRPGDIVLLGFGVWALIIGLLGLFRVIP